MSRLSCARYRQRQTGQSRRHRIDDAMLGQCGPTTERARRVHEPVGALAHRALASADTESERLCPSPKKIRAEG